MAMLSAKTTSCQLGARPRWTWETRPPAFNTSTAPTTMSSTWVARSATAKNRLSFADSFKPRTFSAARMAMTVIPPRMSPGL
jgi:hypothetical protein